MKTIMCKRNDDGDDDDDDGDDDNLRQEVNAKTRTALKVLRCLIGSACFVCSPASPIYIQEPKAPFSVKKTSVLERASQREILELKKPASTPWFHSAEDSPLHVAFAGHVVRPKVRMVKMMNI